MEQQLFVDKHVLFRPPSGSQVLAGKQADLDLCLIADMPPLDLALAGQLLERPGINAKESGNFDRNKQWLKINCFEPILIVLVSGTWGKRYAITTSDVEIMAAFSSDVQDLFRQC